MQQQIKFRGKTLDTNFWVYGDLTTKKLSARFIGDCAIFDDTWHSVNPNTIGQFTGLTDRNGTEIYEGDIIIFPRTNDRYKRKGIVEWCSEKARFIVRKGNSPTNCYRTLKMIPDCEVVGNIHDPEPSEE